MSRLAACAALLVSACTTAPHRPERFSWTELAPRTVERHSASDAIGDTARVSPAAGSNGGSGATERTLDLDDLAARPELDADFELGAGFEAVRTSALAPQSTPAQRLRDPEGWFLEVAPSFWITGLDLNLDLKNTPNHIDTDLNMFDDANGGGQIGFDAMRTDWGFWMTASYVRINGNVNSNQGQGALDFENATAEIALTLLWEGPSLEYFLGGRWQWLDMDLRLPNNPQESADTSWFEPFVGARWKNQIGDTVRIYLRGDLGGFGVGSDLTWNLYGMFQFQLSETWSIDVGYRAMATLLDRASFRYDGRITGLLLGGTFYW